MTTSTVEKELLITKLIVFLPNGKEIHHDTLNKNIGPSKIEVKKNKAIVHQKDGEITTYTNLPFIYHAR